MNESIGQSGSLSFQRPLLILLDRNFDLATPLHHTWTYQAMIHDCFDLKLNRIEMGKSTASSNPTTSSSASSKTYDLLNSDKFWKNQKGNPFPVVAESIQEELEKFKQYDGEIKMFKETMVIINLRLAFHRENMRRSSFEEVLVVILKNPLGFH